MVSLRANTQEVYYALYLGTTEIVNTDGHKTGERKKTYSEPQPIRIYVSPNRGSAEVEQFGINADYTNVMSTFDASCPIGEDTILWIGEDPFITEDTLRPYTHRVQQVARGLNSTLYAVKKVNVSGGAVTGHSPIAVVNSDGEVLTDTRYAPRVFYV